MISAGSELAICSEKRFYPSIKTVELDGMSPLLVSMICSCPNLSRLVIATNELTDHALDSLMKNCPLLKDLRIGNA